MTTPHIENAKNKPPRRRTRRHQTRSIKRLFQRIVEEHFDITDIIRNNIETG